MFLPKLPYMELVIECLTYHHGIPQNIASDQRTLFTANEVYIIGPMEFTYFIMFPNTLKQLA